NVTYKTNYHSLMNYAYKGPAFSHGTLPTLNPTSLDEQLGIGTTDPLVLGLVSQFYPVDVNTGSVDWDRDGIYSPSTTPVQAPTTSTRSPGFLPSVLPVTPAPHLRDGTMTWVTIAGSAGDQLWLVGRGGSG